MNSIERNNNQGDDAIREIPPEGFPRLLKEALKDAKDAPSRLYVRGRLPPEDRIYLTVVGTRRYSDYGKAACEALIAGLRGLPVVIVSGLAFGIDSIAHEAALANGIPTVAVPGSGLSDEMLYPAAHIGLARRILSAGGALLSPFTKTTMGNDWTFPYRNRIMAGMAHATLVIEANKKSGTHITARYAYGFNRDLLVVPGSIFSTKSELPHYLMKDGAIPITSADDLVEVLGLSATKRRAPDHSHLSDHERAVIEALTEPQSRDLLIRLTGLDASTVNATVSMLEIKGIVEEFLGQIKKV